MRSKKQAKEAKICEAHQTYIVMVKALPERLLIAAVGTEPRTEAWLRLADDSCQSGNTLTYVLSALRNV